VEDHLKWGGMNGSLAAVPQWGQGAKPLVGEVWVLFPQKLKTLFLWKCAIL